MNKYKSILIFLVLYCFGCDQINDTKTPEGTARAFLEAMAVNDYEEAKRYSTQSTRKALDQFDSLALGPEEKSTDPIQQITCSIEEETQNNRRVVRCEVCCNARNFRHWVIVEKVQGNWLVNLVKDNLRTVDAYLAGQNPSGGDPVNRINSSLEEMADTLGNVVDEINQELDSLVSE